VVMEGLHALRRGGSRVSHSGCARRRRRDHPVHEEHMASCKRPRGAHSFRAGRRLPTPTAKPTTDPSVACKIKEIYPRHSRGEFFAYPLSLRSAGFGYRSKAKLMHLLAIDILGGPCTPIYLLTLVVPD
jgi:hypothetical protein